MVLEKTLESLLDRKEIKPVIPEGNQPLIFMGISDAEVEVPNFWPLMGRADSLVKTLMLGKMEGKKKRRKQRMRCLDGITDWMDMSLSQLQEMVKHREPGVLRIMGSQSEMTEQLNKSNNTELQTSKSKIYCKQWTKVNNTVLI